MKLSPETIELLNNFSSINNAILISPGNVIRTINSERNVYAKAVVQETFPRDIPIYELREFLNIFKIHRDADVDFSDEQYILVQHNRTRMKFYYADLYSLTRTINLPERDYVLEDVVLSVDIESEQLERVRKAANFYNLTDLSLIGSDGHVELMVHNKEDTTSKTYNIEIAETENEFSMNLIEKNIKILPGSYKLEIARVSGNNYASRFINQNLELEYFISLESDSHYDL
jgi:hypothetical protein